VSVARLTSPYNNAGTPGAMNQVARAHGPGLLLGMLHMSHLAANTAAEDGLMLHAAAAAAGPSSQADMAAAACSTPDSPTDAPQPDFDAAQLQQSHPGFAGSATEDSLQQLKKECKPHKGKVLAGWPAFECDGLATAASLSMLPQEASKPSNCVSYVSRVSMSPVSWFAGPPGTPKKHKAGQGRRQVLVCKVS
jgi:hypothetical protein